MKDLSLFIPKDNTWMNPAIEKIGFEEFKKYADKIYHQLNGMKPGQFFNIEKYVREENQELFIQIVCMFFTDYGEPFQDFEFNKTATIITRIEKKMPAPVMSRGWYDK